MLLCITKPVVNNKLNKMLDSISVDFYRAACNADAV